MSENLPTEPAFCQRDHHQLYRRGSNPVGPRSRSNIIRICRRYGHADNERHTLKRRDCLSIGDLPNVVVMDYTESGLSVRLLSRAKDQTTAFAMERDILYQIRKEFMVNGIEIAYPRREVVFVTRRAKN
jgi:small-conductance mechanosensitive channel